MNIRRLIGSFALILSVPVLLSFSVAGTVAYVFAISPKITNTFAYDPSVFPLVDQPCTGDSSSLVLWGFLLALSVICLWRFKKSRRKSR